MKFQNYITYLFDQLIIANFNLLLKELMEQLN